ncbi:hypothetical protein RSOL_209260 [Rhizoctonia solani AG-3 Rhs1AP]|uniref:Uncharacterized protein n=1 Tax=Rhizoctonia solani AG-3 Rhs1AP TaxID=1086054 RepID=X8J7G6_9AGAM|nr:hypothetical protein RSOL_209260 [Rhizoctonia solani AG-3 Rhs1AP]
MSSLFSWVARLTRYLTGARSPSSMNMEFQNRFIFPNDPPRGAQYFDHGYVPWQLLEAIQQDRDAVDGIGHIYVSSAKYCKKPKGAQHEFLIFVVKDDTCDYRQNALIIDRVASPGRIDNRDSPPANLEDLTENDRRALRGEPVASNGNVLESTLTSSQVPIARGMSSNGGSSISNSLTGIPALDMCRVSAHGGFKDMAQRLTLTPYTCIAELKFSDTSFTLEKLLNLAATLSNHEPHYDLFKTQCYWYALMLWGLVQRVTGTAATTDPFTTMRAGPNHLVPWLLAQNHSAERQNELDELVAEYERKWISFLEELPRWKNQGVKALMDKINSRPTAPVVQDAPIVPSGQ